MQIPATCAIIMLLWCFAVAVAGEQGKFPPGEIWPEINGTHINARVKQSMTTHA